MVKIQVGKRYVRRDGVISGVIEPSGYTINQEYKFTDEFNGLNYTGSGRYYVDSIDGRDLIKEYKEPKMRKKQPKKLPEKKKSLVIEDGKFYKNGNGAILGPMQYDEDYEAFVCTKTGASFINSGECCNSIAPSLNLVEEYKPSLGDMPPGTIMLSDDGKVLGVKHVESGIIKILYIKSQNEFVADDYNSGSQFTGTVIGTMKQ